MKRLPEHIQNEINLVKYATLRSMVRIMKDCGVIPMTTRREIIIDTLASQYSRLRANANTHYPGGLQDAPEDFGNAVVAVYQLTQTIRKDY